MTPLEPVPPVPGPSSPARGRALRFAFRALEVRLRMFLAMGLAIVCVAGWPYLQNVWDRARHRLAGHQSNAAVSGDIEFFCPMDPGVQSAWPAICPICNMDLVPRKKSDAQILPEGVLARMQLSPYRVQLAGLRTSPVEVRELTYELKFGGVLRSAPDSETRFFEAAAAPSDVPLLKHAKTAIVRPSSSAEPALEASVRLVESSGDRSIPMIRLELSSAKIPDGTPVEAVVAVSAESLREEATQVTAEQAGLAIPESAVVDRGHDRLVFVETMAGMYDAVPVRLGRRCGNWYPVLEGLKRGQRVATTGSFLIDAETRLDPGLAIQYFGAGQQTAKAPAAIPNIPQSARLAKKLLPADQALADRQKICPVTDLPLDSMGGAIAVEVSGRKVFLCCKGCEGRLRENPQKFFAKLDSRLKPARP